MILDYTNTFIQEEAITMDEIKENIKARGGLAEGYDSVFSLRQWRCGVCRVHQHGSHRHYNLKMTNSLYGHVKRLMQNGNIFIDDAETQVNFKIIKQGKGGGDIEYMNMLAVLKPVNLKMVDSVCKRT